MNKGSSGDYVLTMDTINPCVKGMEGSIVTRAGEIERRIASGIKKPFAKVLMANIGDSHATGQTLLKFVRQVIALCSYPELMKSNEFPADAKIRAQRIQEGCLGYSVGSYSDNCGVEVIRKDIAEYISRQDGLPSTSEDIILCKGASDGIKSILTLLMTGKDGKERAGIMIPVPQYPLILPPSRNTTPTQFITILMRTMGGVLKSVNSAGH